METIQKHVRIGWPWVIYKEMQSINTKLKAMRTPEYALLLRQYDALILGWYFGIISFILIPGVILIAVFA